MTEHAWVELGARAKRMSGQFGVRETLTRVPDSLVLQLLAPEVKTTRALGSGVHDYDHEHHRHNSTDQTKEEDQEEFGTAVFLLAADEHGHTVSVRVHSVPLVAYVQCPDWFGEAEMHQLAEYFSRRLHTRITFERHHRKHFCSWQPDPQDASRTREWNYCALEFPSVGAMRYATRVLKESITLPPIGTFQFHLHESGIDPVQKVLERLRLTPSGWFRVRRFAVPERYFTHAQLEVECAARDVEAMPERNHMAPVWKCSWDIECYSHDGSFPDAHNERDFVICISTYVSQHLRPDSPPLQVCHHLGPVRAPPDVHVIECSTERELIERWRDFLVLDVQPHVTEGYNVNGFDYGFLAVKAGARRVEPRDDKSRAHWQCSESRFFRQSTFIDDCTPLVERDLSSAAKGENVHLYVPAAGRLSIDLFHVIKDNHRLVSYTLRDVCEEFFRDRRTGEVPEALRKIDVPPQKIWANYDAGPEQRAETVLYCARDAALPMRLEEHLQALTNMVEMSRITRTPLTQILTRGQQIKTWNQIVYYAHQFGFVVNRDADEWRPLPSPAVVVQEEDAHEGFRGAIVLDPKAGYYDAPITVQDFASLYPSIMQANNLCCSCLVQDARHRGLPGARYRDVQPAPDRTHTFVQHVKGVVPRILDTLKTWRKAVRDEQKRVTKGSTEWQLLEGRQQAIKITANSVYGFFGVQSGIMPCVAVSESVTCIGREMITLTRTWVETELPQYLEPELHATVTRAEVIYGDTDSVMIRFEGVPRTRDGVALSLRIGDRLARYITGKFATLTGTKDIELAMEKVYWPYVLFKKKRYAGVVWTPDVVAGKAEPRTDAKGLEVKRRDSWLSLRTTYKQCLDAMLLDMDLERAKSAVLNLLSDVSHNRLPLEAYVVSKSLKKQYDAARLPPHAVVRDKMRARTPGSEPKSGNRVPYVIVEHHGDRVSPLDVTRRLRAVAEARTVPARRQNTDLRVADKAEDPEYVRAHADTVRVDRLYYLETLVNPFCTLLEPCFENPEALFRDAMYEVARQRSRLPDVRAFFVPRESPASVESADEQAAKRVRRRAEDGSYVPRYVRAEQRRQQRKTPPAAVNSMLRFLVRGQPQR